MAVWFRQSVDGVPDERPRVVSHDSHRDLDGDDAALLRRKAKGATDKGWAVTWQGTRRFTATKVRWGGEVCTRTFWLG